MDQERLSRILTLLHTIILQQLDGTAQSWFTEKVKALKEEGFGRNFYLSFSSAPRFIGKKPLSISKKELEDLQSLREGLRPDSWTIDQAVRMYFIMLLPSDSAEKHLKWIMDLFDTADMGEQAAIFAVLPLLPFPEQYLGLASEGVRTNMIVVLEAIGLNNPYPADYMEENAWNQLFLKCVFTGRSLYKIIGIKRRANAELARIISDYAHERWAAGREVTPEIWQPVPPFFMDRHLEDMSKLFKDVNPLQQLAAGLTCIETDNQDAQALLNSYTDIKQRIMSEEISWLTIGKEWEAQQQS